MSDTIFLGGPNPQHLVLRRANRHGLIAGATGTGKTVTLQVLAEAFSRAGVPVFAADVRGDLAGIALPGDPKGKLHERFTARATELGISDYACRAPPVMFWDLYGAQGHPLRATMSDLGPVLLARILELSDAQEGVLNVAFHLADIEGLELLNFDDLKTLIRHVAENAQEVSKRYGLVQPTTAAAIQRKLLQLDMGDAAQFFGEPALDLADFIRTDANGHGFVNVLAADRLIGSPRLYSTFLLWLMSELFERLPEIGDPDKPKLVFFFDEAHLLFKDAPKALLDKIEQVVRLIRSKGVGIYFVTQNPQDVPETVLAQLSNRVQHALRAYTPSETKAVRIAAASFRPNPAFSTEAAITTLEVGEALVSTLDEKGTPGIVERTKIRPPEARLGPLSAAERVAIQRQSPVAGKYDTMLDRESAHEKLSQRKEKADAAADREAEHAAKEAVRAKVGKETGTKSRGAGGTRSNGGSRRQGMFETFMKSVLRQAGSQITREITRGVLGGRRRR